MSHKADEPWQIERLVAGDGSLGPVGVRLRQGRYYGSAALHGGNETFWEIDIDTVSLRTRAASQVTFSVQAATGMARLKPAPKGNLVVTIRKSYSQSKRQKVLRNAVQAFCKRHPGFAVILGGPGESTVSIDKSSRFQVSAGAVFMQASDGECLAAALVNAVDIVKGRAAAEKARLAVTERSSQYLSIASCARDMHQFCRGFDLRKLQKADFEGFRSDPFGWLGSLHRGVWLVRLVKPRFLDHCVVIDGVRKLIFDSADQYPLGLSADALRMCGGGETEGLLVAEVREVRQGHK